jgi:hypothetical protein
MSLNILKPSLCSNIDKFFYDFNDNNLRLKESDVTKIQNLKNLMEQKN